MSANPPHPPGPGGDRRAESGEPEDNALSGGTHGILAVTLATLGLALTAAAIAALIAWLV